ncbi:MAG: hypothetical protein KDD26_05985 [Winogradskyella sp.]|nr:hypothetical protein [Winogradskyella sp.]
MDKHISFPDFSIEGVEQKDVLRALDFDIKDTLCLEEAERYIWPYSDKLIEKNKIRTIISEELDNWIFIYWSSDIDEHIKEVINILMKVSNGRINYHSMDSVTSDYHWIIANQGKIIREFYSCWNIEINEGKPLTELENKFIASFENDEFIFGEDVCQSIYELTCGVNLKKYKNDTKFKVGNVILSEN